MTPGQEDTDRCSQEMTRPIFTHLVSQLDRTLIVDRTLIEKFEAFSIHFAIRYHGHPA